MYSTWELDSYTATIATVFIPEWEEEALIA